MINSYRLRPHYISKDQYATSGTSALTVHPAAHLSSGSFLSFAHRTGSRVDRMGRFVSKKLEVASFTRDLIDYAGVGFRGPASPTMLRFWPNGRESSGVRSRLRGSKIPRREHEEVTVQLQCTPREIREQGQVGPSLRHRPGCPHLAVDTNR
jgi:hypothetical protein